MQEHVPIFIYSPIDMFSGSSSSIHYMDSNHRPLLLFPSLNLSLSLSLFLHLSLLLSLHPSQLWRRMNLGDVP